MVKKFAALLAFLLLAVLILAASQADTLVIQRSVTIRAPVDKAMALVQDFHAWEQWSPWDRLDPQVQRTYAGAHAGVGAIYAWQGDERLGSGRMTITAVEPGRSVHIKLDTAEPWAAGNTAAFTFEPSGASTRVTWTMTDAHRSFASKWTSLFMNMDAVTGADMEAGLESLQALAEKP